VSSPGPVRVHTFCGVSTDFLGSAVAVQVPDLLSLRARQCPDRAPLSVEGKVWLTFGEWDARSNAVAHHLLDRGVRRGVRVGLLFAGMDWVDYAIAYFGVLKAGGTATHLCELLGHAEVRRRLGQAGAAGVIRGAALAAPEGFDGWTVTVAETGADTSPVPARVAPEDIADILYTSGTTGPAKAFLNPHGNLSFGRGWGVQAEAIFDQDAPLLSPLPVGTAYSASTAGVFALTTTAPIIVSPPQDVERMAELIGRHRVASVMVRPRAAMRMVDTGVQARHDLTSVTVLGIASCSLPPRYGRQLLAMMPNARIATAYGGGSEAVPAHLRTQYDPRRPQNMGAAQPGTQMLIADEAGRPVPVGELGEIWLRTEAPRRFYLDQAMNEKVHVHGWVRTGDLGRVGPDGQLSFFDRMQDAIRTAGGLISSIEVENALYEHPAVDQAAVFGIPEGAREQRVIAAVTLMTLPGQEPDLRAFLAGRIAPHKIPDAVHVLAVMPRHRVSDKILKFPLRERFTAEMAPRPPGTFHDAS